MTKFQFGQKVVVSTVAPNHAGKVGLFRFESVVNRKPVAIIEDSKSGRQFKVNLEHVEKIKYE